MALWLFIYNLLMQLIFIFIIFEIHCLNCRWCIINDLMIAYIFFCFHSLSTSLFLFLQPQYVLTLKKRIWIFIGKSLPISMFSIFVQKFGAKKIMNIPFKVECVSVCECVIQPLWIEDVFICAIRLHFVFLLLWRKKAWF